MVLLTILISSITINSYSSSNVSLGVKLYVPSPRGYALYSSLCNVIAFLQPFCFNTCAALPVNVAYATLSSDIFNAAMINLISVDLPLPAGPDRQVYVHYFCIVE